MHRTKVRTFPHTKRARNLGGSRWDASKKALLPALMTALLLFGWAALAFSPAPTYAASGVTSAVNAKAARSILKMLRGCTRILHEKLPPRHSFEARTLFLDEQQRIFLAFDGTVGFENPGRRLSSILEKARGRHLATNGAISIDFTIIDLERTPAPDGHVTLVYTGDLVIIVPHLMAIFVKQAAVVAGGTASTAAIERLTEFAAGIDVEVFGKAISKGLDTLNHALLGDASLNLYRMLSYDKAMKVKEAVLSRNMLKAMLLHFAATILATAGKSGGTFAALSMGSAVGAALNPTVGAFIGSVIAVGAVSYLGDVVIDYISTDLPLWWKLRKIARAQRTISAGASLSESKVKEALETQRKIIEDILRRIEKEAREDKYAFFDKVVKALKKARKEGKAAELAPLYRALKEKTAFLVVKYGDDWHAARKYYQLLEAMDDLPYERSGADRTEEDSSP